MGSRLWSVELKLNCKGVVFLLLFAISPMTCQKAEADGADLFRRISRRSDRRVGSARRDLEKDLEIEQELQPSYEGVFQIQFANDVFFDSDKHFTNGVSLFWQPRLVDGWEQTYLPNLLANWVSRVPLLNTYKTKKRIGFALVHITVTPEDLLASEVIPNDLPYTGFLGALFQLSSSNDEQLDTVQLTLGLVGKSSFAEPIQKEVHRLTQTDVPQGWPNQLKDEFIVNVDLVHARRFLSLKKTKFFGMSFDLDWRASGGLGNLFSYGSIGVGARFGWNLISGWEIPPTGNRAISNNFHDYSHAPDYSFYFYSILESFAIAHAIFLDGNLDSKGHTVTRVPFQSKAAIGLVFKAHNFVYRVSYIRTTRIFREAKDDYEQAGVIDIAYIF